MRRARTDPGFTLLELLVVLAVMTVLLTIALPLLLAGRIAAGEAAAVGTLQLIAKAEMHFAGTGAADVDGNGVGEYGTLAEMAGSVPVRAAAGGTLPLAPNFVSPGFQGVTVEGELQRGGYRFRIYLPDEDGNGVAELPGGGAAEEVDPHRSESLWCAYAWPQGYERTGRRTFFTNQTGTVLFTEDPDYSGTGAPILPGAALLPGHPPECMVGIPAIGDAARDGNVWRPLGN